MSDKQMQDVLVLDLENTISSFTQLGMTDPLHPNKSFEGAIANIEKLDYNTDVYASIVKTPQIKESD